MNAPMTTLARPGTLAREAGGPGAGIDVRLARLKSKLPRAGEASFFYYEAHFKSIAVKVLPGEYYVDSGDVVILTTLGSCIAACLWDRQAQVGGMNHFMLPDSGGDISGSGRYGSYAMEVLINELQKRGATRSTLEAKVFGGGQVISGMQTLNVGQRNTDFVLDYLRTERIPVVSKDVLDVYPRKVCFLAGSGKAMVKRLAPTHADALAAQERAAVRAAPASAGGSVDLF